MKRAMNPWKLILFLSYVIFTAHTVAEPVEGVLKEFIARRHLLREARLSERTSTNLRSRPVSNLEKSETNEVLSSSTSNDYNWAGAVQVSSPSGTFNFVSAQWTVPTISPPASGPGDWYNAVWVGIDGETCTSAILQAGTISTVAISNTGEETTGTSFWFEWYPNPLIEISGFSVSAGDSVEVSVTAESDSFGKVVIKNFSKGTSATIPVSAPDTSNVLCGINAEWIVEDIENSGGFLPFAHFTEVTFTNVKATTTTGAMVDLTNAELLQIVQDSDTLATPTLVSSTELQVYYG